MLSFNLPICLVRRATRQMPERVAREGARGVGREPLRDLRRQTPGYNTAVARGDVGDEGPTRDGSAVVEARVKGPAVVKADIAGLKLNRHWLSKPLQRDIFHTRGREGRTRGPMLKVAAVDDVKAAGGDGLFP